MEHHTYNIHQPIHILLVKFIKIFEKSNVQRVTQNSQDTTKSYKKQPPYPLCNRQRTVNLHHTMYNVQFAIFFIQCTMHNI